MRIDVTGKHVVNLLAALAVISAVVGGGWALKKALEPSPQPAKNWRLVISGAKDPLEVSGVWKQDGACQVLTGPQEIRVCVPHVAVEITQTSAKAAPAIPAPAPTPETKGGK